MVLVHTTFERVTCIVRTGIDQKRGCFMRTIMQVLDKAQRAQKVKSDYKLGLCLGIGAASLSNYRLGKTLPDEKACLKLAAAMDEDPGVLVAEMQAQRAKDDETRALWLSIAKRLQQGFASCKFLAALAIVSIAAAALPAWAAIGFISFSVEQSVYYVKRMINRIVLIWIEQLSANVKVCKAGPHVPRHPHPAPARPA